MTGRATYCTILSTNYLPKALALAESLRRHEDGAVLRILFIDLAEDDQLPDLPGVVCLSTASLGLSRRSVRELAMSYDLVEFATAVKPLLLQRLLEDADQAVYLDPDTYLTAPMVELPGALEASAGGILLTPHFLGPPPPGADHSDGHLLLVGVNNLGFCAVDRRSLPALEWWWSHLSTECLYDPLAGLFVDQKWMDIGSSHFQAASFRHAGYNVSVANLWERPLALDADGYRIASTGERLRLFHFHAFDSSAPEKLSLRALDSYAHLVQDDSVLLQLCKEYAGVLSSYEEVLAAGTAVPLRQGHPGPVDLTPAPPGLRQGAPDERPPAAVALRRGRRGGLRALASAGGSPRHRPRASARERQVRAHRAARGVRPGQEALSPACRVAAGPLRRWDGQLGLNRTPTTASASRRRSRRCPRSPRRSPGPGGSRARPGRPATGDSRSRR